jgi:hypothetical protein
MQCNAIGRRNKRTENLRVSFAGRQALLVVKATNETKRKIDRKESVVDCFDQLLYSKSEYTNSCSPASQSISHGNGNV